jgi:DNA-binding MarR family transcriptional regulator
MTNTNVSNQAEGSVQSMHPSPSRLEQAAELLQEVLRAHHPLDDPAWDEIDLTLAQLKGLRVLSHGPTTIGGFASQLGISQPTASLLVERLVRPGLVERSTDPTDRRRALVRLAPLGERIVARLRGNFHDRLLSELARLSDPELDALVRGLQALTTTMTDETRPPTT